MQLTYSLFYYVTLWSGFRVVTGKTILATDKIFYHNEPTALILYNVGR